MTNIPAGWKLVPIEPTDEMETAAENDYEQRCETFPDWKAKYRVMLAAAPAAPGAEQDASGNTAGERDAWFAGIEAGHDSARHNAAIRSNTGGSALLCAARAVVAADDAQALTSQLINVLRAACEDVGAHAAGDARDAARYRQLRKALTSYDTSWLDRIAAALDAHKEQS